MNDLWRMSATELAAAIRSRQASSLEVVEAHLRRIAAVDPYVNAITVLLSERVIEAARAADRVAAAGGDLPPLHGVPFTVKENIDLAGAPTTQGLKALAGAYPLRDAPGAERIRAAGGIPLGHTNCPDFGIRWHAESELWGATVNPWDRSRTPGGSSGGEAAALATGMTPLGIGGGVGGSLRWPAQCCGISSLKPTLGRVPHATTIEPADLPISSQLMMVEGPMARRVADLRAAFALMSGPTWRDPWTVPAPLHGPAPATPVRVALVTDPAGQGVCAQVADGLQKAARILHDAGYLIEEAEPPSVDAAARTWLDILISDTRAGWQFLAPLCGADTNRFVTELMGLAPELEPAATMQSFMARQSLLRVWGEFQQAHPLIVAPVCTGAPWQVGRDLTADGVAEIVRGMRMAVAVNVLGLPAVALPVGTGDGLPQVVQVIGARYREDMCLDAAAVLEDGAGIITPIDPR